MKTESAARIVPLTPRAKDVLVRLRRCPKLSPWVFPAKGAAGHRTAIQKAHSKAIKDSGLDPFEFYCWRHTFGTRCAEAGLDKYAIAELMGHSSPAIAEKHYIKVSQKYVTRSLDKLIQYQHENGIGAMMAASQAAPK